MDKNGLLKRFGILSSRLMAQCVDCLRNAPGFLGKIRTAAVLSILFVSFFAVKSYGSDTNNGTKGEVIISRQWESFMKTSGEVFFLFSQAEMAYEHFGNAFLFASEAVVNSSFKGNIYSFMSEVKIGENGYVEGRVYTISSLITSIGEHPHIEPIAFWESLLFEAEREGVKLIYDSRLPAVVFLILLCMSRLIMCLVLYGLKPGFFNQGSVILDEDAQDVIQFGLLAYALILASSLVFLLSVIGVAFTFLILACGFLFSLLGQISLEMSLGNLILSRLGINKGPYASITVGGIILESAVLIPVIGISANLFFFPILCLGVFATNFINGFYRKKFYTTAFDEPLPLKAETHRDTVRNILASGKPSTLEDNING